MIMAKVLTILFFIIFSTGCYSIFDCLGPTRPQGKECTGGYKIIDKPAGKNYALGLVAKAVVDDNKKWQDERGNVVNYSNYPFDDPYPIHVMDLSKLDVGKIYILTNILSDSPEAKTARDADKFENVLKIKEGPYTEAEFRKRVEELHKKHGH